MPTITANWAPCNVAWPSYQQYLTDNQGLGTSPKAWAGITSVTFNHVNFIGSGGVDIYSTQDLATLSFPNLERIETVDPNGNPGEYLQPLFNIISNDALTQVQCPSLTFVGGHESINIAIINNAALTNINMPLVVFDCDNVDINFSGNALSQSCVDQILARADASPVPSGTVKNIRLNGGTSSAPSGAGLASKASLITKGWNPTTN